jgi:predicted phosphodiesterase
LSYRERNQIDTLICPGDFLDCFKVSGFTNYQYVEMSFKEELDVASNVLSKLKVFNSIYFVRGNHESFWLKKLEGYNSVSDLFKLFTSGMFREGKDYMITNYDHCMLNDDWYICHPVNYSRIPLSVPRRLANKLHMNVCCAHMHRLAVSKDESGKYYAIETGGLFDIEKIEYLKSSTTYPMQYNGFIRIKNEEPVLIF